MAQVRSAAKEVCAQPEFVWIDRHKIRPYVAALPLTEATAPQLETTRHYIGEPAATAAFFVTLDTINFGSGYFPHLQKLAGMSGYFTVATRLTDHFRRHGPLTAERMAALTDADCAELFHQELDGASRSELMSLFAQALNALGRLLAAKYARSAERLVEAAGHSADRLIGLLCEMPYFQDVQQYRRREVPFYKRAQLMAADLSLALPDHPLGRFDDLDELTIFADNLVPHVLHADGILIYREDLIQRIESGELIAAGSMEEVEIRASAVRAVGMMAGALEDQGKRVTERGLDYLLWNRGQQPGYKSQPRHRTRTVYY
jgi:putative queuosine salvage protein